MEESKAIALFRIAKSYNTYLEAKSYLESGAYNEAINRAYYSMFYCANAVLILNSMMCRKHEDVINNFNKIGTFDRRFGHILHESAEDAYDCDYGDFVIAMKKDAQENVSNALEFFEAVSSYVFERTREMTKVDLVVHARVSPEYIDEFYESTPRSVLTEENIMMLVKMFNDGKS